MTKTALEAKIVDLEADSRLRNRIIREALKTRLAVQLDLAIAMREKDYKAAQDEMIEHRQTLLAKAKNEEKDQLRPQLSKIVAEMEGASFSVSEAKTLLS